MHRRILLALFAAIAIAQVARADSPSVTAVLSNSEVTVGETVDLQIKVSGPGDAPSSEPTPATSTTGSQTASDQETPDAAFVF